MPEHVSFDAHPDHYRHWRLRLDGEVAWLVLDVDEQGGLSAGYDLKLNSYDLGVDIELNDAVQRLRFEHPEVRVVVVTGAPGKVFCAGANIRMLAQAGHPAKVNFCKFTNETRLAIEDAAEHSGQAYIAALGGSATGGGYELALACDHIILVDDGSSVVALPEAPLLGVLPGTGGLTRLTDKRHIRRDLADVFTTRPEGVKGKTALEWGLVDEIVPKSRFEETVRTRAQTFVDSWRVHPKPALDRWTRHESTNQGVALTPLRLTVTAQCLAYSSVRADLGTPGDDVVSITVSGPDEPPPVDPVGRGAEYWPLRLAREFEDLVLRLRTNEPELGTWVIRTRGDPSQVMAYDQQLAGDPDGADPGTEWFLNEVRHYLKRVLKRLDVTSRSLIALVEPGSCFAGPLLELALAADRTYMLDASPDTVMILGETNFDAFPMGNGLTRLASRFYGAPEHVDVLRKRRGEPLTASECADLGLVTGAPDDLDWDDEVRLALEERAAFSPDALTGLEANLRFAGPETLETKIFGRLSAWQNWVFNRPNAGGPDGALSRYGTGQPPSFDRRRT